MGKKKENSWGNSNSYKHFFYVINCHLFFQWFAGNYAYQIALSDTEAGVVNVISSTSGLFTLILAAIFPSTVADKFSISKLISVLLMVLGVVSVGI